MTRNIILASAAVLISSTSIASAEPPDDLPDLGPIQDDLEEIRQLAFRSDVPAEQQSTDEFREYLEADIETFFPEEEFSNIVAALHRLGIVNEPFDMGDELINAMLTQAGAYYDPEQKKFFYLMTGLGGETLKTIAAHELVHAMQDQHFDLNTLLQSLEAMLVGDGPRDDDRVLAARSVVEGEASYVQTIWQMRQMGHDLLADEASERAAINMTAAMPLDQIVEMARMQAAALPDDLGASLEAMATIPRYILEPLYAAYMKGARFAMEVRQAGGWNAMNHVYADMPATTEQILHPAKYIGPERDAPTRITLPDMPQLSEAGWAVIDSAIHGELYLELLLQAQDVSARRARRAASGWDGDIYRAYRHEDGRVMFILATTWDSKDDAEEYREAYTTALDTKYPDRMDEEDEDELTLSFKCGGVDEHGNALGFGKVVQRGRDLFIVEGAEQMLINRVMQRLLEIDIEHVDTVRVKQIEPPLVGERIDVGGFSFIAHPDWKKEEPSSTMRIAQYRLPGNDDAIEDDDASLVLYYFGGGGGSVEANMERWRAQIESTEEAKIEQFEVSGKSVHTIDTSGTYVAETRPGSGQRVNKSSWRLFAAVIQTDDGPYFLKVVGPDDTVATWRASCRAMLKSIE